MLPDLSEFKNRRIQLRLTQTQLAELSGVSQSVIAKIESQKTVPSYDNAQKLWNALEKTEHAFSLNAEHVMRSPVKTISQDETVLKAIRLFKRHGFSHLPVVQNQIVVGTLSKKEVFKLIGGHGLEHQRAIEHVMPPLPQFPAQTPLFAIRNALAHFDAALLTQNGKLAGIVSRSDVLKTVLDKKITRHHRLI